MHHIIRIIKKHYIVICIAFVLLCIVGAIAVYYFYQYQNTRQLMKNPTIAGQVEIQTVVNNVGKLLYLPQDEQPTIATVSDYKKLQNQVFFQHAKNGFKVLIYTKAKLAILYDPFTNKVVTIGPVTTNQANLAAQKPVTVAVYNGAQIQGLTAVIEQELKDKLPFISVVEKSNANFLYPNTLIFDVTGNHQSAVSQLATLLGGQALATAPYGEKLPVNADLLIILGKK